MIVNLGCVYILLLKYVFYLIYNEIVLMMKKGLGDLCVVL